MLHSLKTRLTTFILALIIITAIIITSITYLFIHKNIMSLSINYNNQLASQLCSNMELFLSDIEKETNSISQSPDLKFYGNYFITQNLSPSHETIRRLFWDSASRQPDIDDISLLFNGKKILSLYNLYDEETLLELTGYYTKQEILYESKFIPILHRNSNDKPAFSCIKAISNSSSGKDDFFILTSTNVDELFDILNQIDLGPGSGSCLVDSKGSIQYSTLTDEKFSKDFNTLLSNKDFSTISSFIETFNGRKYLISANSLSNSRMSAVIYTPLSNITGSLIRLLYTLLGIILVILALVIYISIQLSNKLTAPITTLSGSIKDMDGKLVPLIPMAGTTETDLLYVPFNEMILRINQLLQKNAEDNELKRKAELQALQYQINPHFLYNTLDSINAMAILRNDSDISTMTTSLAHLLRLSLGQPGEYVTIADEINHIKSYLTIQKIRYDDKFDVKFDIQDNLRNYRIVRLILQPLVENSIYLLSSLIVTYKSS